MSGAHYAVRQTPCAAGCGQRARTSLFGGELLCWTCWEWATNLLMGWRVSRSA